MLLDQRSVDTVIVSTQTVPRLAWIQAWTRMRHSSVSRPSFT